MIIDLKSGTLSGITPSTPANIIKKRFPCFTYAEEGTESANKYNYGGAVSFQGYGLTFYTKAKAISISGSFRGSLSIEHPNTSFMNHFRNNKNGLEKELAGFKLFKHYKETKSSDAISSSVYEAPYGCLIIELKDTDISKIVITNNSCEDEVKNKRFIRE